VTVQPHLHDYGHFSFLDDSNERQKRESIMKLGLRLKELSFEPLPRCLMDLKPVQGYKGPVMRMWKLSLRVAEIRKESDRECCARESKMYNGESVGDACFTLNGTRVCALISDFS
jgi:hypothetical protein